MIYVFEFEAQTRQDLGKVAAAAYVATIKFRLLFMAKAKLPRPSHWITKKSILPKHMMLSTPMPSRKIDIRLSSQSTSSNAMPTNPSLCNLDFIRI